MGECRKIIFQLCRFQLATIFTHLAIYVGTFIGKKQIMNFHFCMRQQVRMQVVLQFDKRLRALRKRAMHKQPSVKVHALKNEWSEWILQAGALVCPSFSSNNC